MARVRISILMLGIAVIIAALPSFAQTKPADAPKPHPATGPGNINLPEGYIYEGRNGIDSYVGAFVRSDGFTISHDIGKMAANYAYQYFPENFERLRKQTHLNSDAIERQIRVLQDKIAWRRRQKVNGADVMVVVLNDSTLIACFVDSSANFIATADSADKIADFFLIVLTYHPINKST